jgi:hypothetical protein
MAEGKVLSDPVRVGFIDDRGGAQGTAALGVFGLEQVALAGMGAHHFSSGSDLKSFCHRFVCLYSFRASHIA